MSFPNLHDILTNDDIESLSEANVSKEVLDSPYRYSGKMFYPLMTCVYNFSHKCMRELVENKGCDVNITNKQLSTPLHVAAFSKNYVALKYLLENGADVDAQDKWKRTAVFHAAHYNDFRMVRHLLTMCDVSIQDVNKNTIFTYKNVSDNMREFLESQHIASENTEKLEPTGEVYV